MIKYTMNLQIVSLLKYHQVKVASLKRLIILKQTEFEPRTRI